MPFLFMFGIFPLKQDRQVEVYLNFWLIYKLTCYSMFHVNNNITLSCKLVLFNFTMSLNNGDIVN